MNRRTSKIRKKRALKVRKQNHIRLMNLLHSILYLLNEKIKSKENCQNHNRFKILKMKFEFPLARFQKMTSNFSQKNLLLFICHEKLLQVLNFITIMKKNNQTHSLLKSAGTVITLIQYQANIPNQIRLNFSLQALL